jgi:Bacterial antitoxin of type II TA system, VapB
VVWVTHMKTTIDIADALLRQAKRIAARRHSTLREVIEGALRDSFAREESDAAGGPVQTHTFRGRGLQQGVSWTDWATLRALAYEGRGG